VSGNINVASAAVIAGEPAPKGIWVIALVVDKAIYMTLLFQSAL